MSNFPSELGARFARIPACAFVCLLGACAADPPSLSSDAGDNCRPAELIDLDGDGVNDGISVDVNSDGIAEGVDTDADGRPDAPLSGCPSLPEPDAGSPQDVCPPNNPYCDEDGGMTEVPPGCGEEVFDLTPVGVNVMVTMDGSNSMNTFWEQVQQAIADMINESSNANYGMHLFWGEAVENVIDGVLAGFNFCGQTQNRVLDVAPDQHANILPFMGPQAPGQGNQFFDLTPVVDPLNYYLENTTNLEDPESTNYLVFISDGNENCFGTAFAGDADKRLAYEKLAIELGKKHIRILPIGFNASNGQMTSGPGGEMQTTDFEALDTLAKAGGTGLDQALAADDEAELAQALQTVAQRVRPCRFQIPATLDPSQNLNPFELNFVLGGEIVPRDRTRTQGWNFVDGNTSEVELYGQACEAVRLGTTLEARKGCQADVCGTAATQVSTKERAVLYLLDSSLTMGECSVPGDFACAPKEFCENSGGLFCDPAAAGNLSWWGVMTKAIGSSVVDEVNESVEFGLRMFPSSDADVSQVCLVNDQSEVEPAPGTELSVIGWLLSDLPLGFTPLTEAIERVAANPGRLAAEEVSGALILLSDGGDSTSCEVEADEAITRSAQAASNLLDMGVKTYVVRFGARDESSDTDDRLLRAIAENGGTASNDPSKPPYLDAPDEATLNGLLAGISEELASCGLTLGELDSQADKDQVNLYLNGEVVPFDADGAKQGGWGWTDPDQTEIELYGDHCTEFKNNRITSLVVELGCEQVIVI